MAKHAVPKTPTYPTPAPPSSLQAGSLPAVTRAQLQKLLERMEEHDSYAELRDRLQRYLDKPDSATIRIALDFDKLEPVELEVPTMAVVSVVNDLVAMARGEVEMLGGAI